MLAEASRSDPCMLHAQSPCQSPSLVPVPNFTRMLESDRDYIIVARGGALPHETRHSCSPNANTRMRIVLFNIECGTDDGTYMGRRRYAGQHQGVKYVSRDLRELVISFSNLISNRVFRVYSTYGPTLYLYADGIRPSGMLGVLKGCASCSFTMYVQYMRVMESVGHVAERPWGIMTHGCAASDQSCTRGRPRPMLKTRACYTLTRWLRAWSSCRILLGPDMLPMHQKVDQMFILRERGLWS